MYGSPTSFVPAYTELCSDAGKFCAACFAQHTLHDAHGGFAEIYAQLNDQVSCWCSRRIRSSPAIQVFSKERSPLVLLRYEDMCIPCSTLGRNRIYTGFKFDPVM
eukprot:4937394-Amphidinium_carterae.1